MTPGKDTQQVRRVQMMRRKFKVRKTLLHIWMGWVWVWVCVCVWVRARACEEGPDDAEEVQGDEHAATHLDVCVRMCM